MRADVPAFASRAEALCEPTRWKENRLNQHDFFAFFGYYGEIKVFSLIVIKDSDFRFFYCVELRYVAGAALRKACPFSVYSKVHYVLFVFGFNIKAVKTAEG